MPKGQPNERELFYQVGVVCIKRREVQTINPGLKFKIQY